MRLQLTVKDEECRSVLEKLSRSGRHHLVNLAIQRLMEERDVVRLFLQVYSKNSDVSFQKKKKVLEELLGNF